ncbi:hypothetical protein KYJ26_16635 [Bacillus sp. MCCB 382]|uniref:hypothetical protein n=1 Tax=Bacillus sp. MCCB 382 TaxID=2860197 RepID=UPI001C58838E|nr:hypothetical protein [Bacillus sp. MCCB 382]
MRGGQRLSSPNQPGAELIPVETLKIFSIAHNTYVDTYYQPWDQWYINRIATAQDGLYPLTYRMSDGSILTVNMDEETGLLDLSQEYN